MIEDFYKKQLPLFSTFVDFKKHLIQMTESRWLKFYVTKKTVCMNVSNLRDKYKVVCNNIFRVLMLTATVAVCY